MDRFVNRNEELHFLEEQYGLQSSSLVVIYGRRRIGKTSLINEFIKNKPHVFFLASEESEEENMKQLRKELFEFSKDNLVNQLQTGDWDVFFDTMTRYIREKRLVFVIDEFQYLGKTNKAFPSIFQRAWEKYLKKQNIMVILCGSLIRMMEEQTLNYNSPLYGRRTGQIKLQQVQFESYLDFFPQANFKKRIELFAVTGGVPKYIELFNGEEDILHQIERLVLGKQSLLFEEPRFLLQNEVKEVGSYFSVIKSIAAGNHKLSQICADLEVKQTSMSKYLRTLIDLDILAREVPITEKHPESSKMGLYRIKDNFINFWFHFVYPEKSRLERGDTKFVLDKIKANFVDNHVSYIYEDVCLQEMWNVMSERAFPISKIGKWWNGKEEIDIVGINPQGKEIVFGECKYRNKKMDTHLFYDLVRKSTYVEWNKGFRMELFVLFSISGYTKALREIANERDDLILIEHELKK